MLKMRMLKWFAPPLCQLMGPELRHWVPTLISTGVNIVAVVGAWYLQQAARVRARVRVSLTLTLPLTRRPSRSAPSRLWRRRRGCACSMARCSRVSCVPKMGRC